MHSFSPRWGRNRSRASRLENRGRRESRRTERKNYFLRNVGCPFSTRSRRSQSRKSKPRRGGQQNRRHLRRPVAEGRAVLRRTPTKQRGNGDVHKGDGHRRFLYSKRASRSSCHASMT